MIKTGIELVKDKEDFAIVYGYPTASETIETTGKLVVFAMFESTKIPKGWISALSRADMVIVPSKFCQEVFTREYFSHTGKVLNCKVVPLGIGEEWQPIIRPVERDVFTFLHYNAFNDRKGFWELNQAFTEGFKDVNDVRMVYKCNANQETRPISDPRVKIISDDMSIRNLIKLCGDCDCFVFPSKGEGFGLTPLEAAATGMNVITIDAHGIGEYFDDRYFTGVDYEYEPARYVQFVDQDMGMWTRPEPESIYQKMREHYETWKKDKAAYYARGREAAKYASGFTWNDTANKLKDILNG